MRSFLLFILLLIFLQGPVKAQWSNDPNVNTLVASVTGHQEDIHCISDGDGGIVMVWKDPRNVSSEEDVYAQKLDKSGVIQWAVNGVPVCTAANAQWQPAIASDGNGGAIIAWRDGRNDVLTDIYAQRINANGSPQWTDNGVVICSASNTQDLPVIVSDNAGGAIIAWRDSRSGNFDLYAQRVNENGITQWATNGVPVSTDPDRQSEHVIIPDGSGGAIIAWDDGRGGENNIYGQKVDATGAMKWTTNGVVICGAAGDQYFTQCVGDGAGGAVVTWEDYRNSAEFADIFAQRIDAAGSVQWGTNGVAICVEIWDQFDPKPVTDGAGGAIIVWGDWRTDLVIEYYAQRVNAQGSVLWATNGIPVTGQTVDEVDNQVIVEDGNGGAIIAWQDGNFGQENIYAQRINGSGVKQWETEGVVISSADRSQEFPVICTDLNGGAILGWEDSRNIPTGIEEDIYAQQISANGNLGELLAIEEPGNTGTRTLRLLQNYPNPFSQSTTIGFFLREPSIVRLTVLDMLGNEVETILDEFRPAGRGEVRFDATSLENGIYFYRLSTSHASGQGKMIIRH